jgi:hypothetical protein
MKNIKIYFILLLLFGFSSVFAQVTRSETNGNDRVAISQDDPKISPEEQALILTAGEDNPAKIDEASLVDPKINPEGLATEKDYGPSNAKPAGDQNTDPKLNAEQTQKERQDTPEPVSQPVSGGSQPEGDKNGTLPDYRNMQGDGKDQPQGDLPENIPDYRKMQGSKDQPAGDTPNK